MAINFPDSPVPGQIFQSYVWDGEKWLGASSVAASSVVGAVRYDAAQALTSTQGAQARANIAVTKKNYIVNGAMQISQENGTNFSTVTGYYPVDMFSLSIGNTTGVLNVAQGVAVTPGGSTHRLRCSVATADAAMTGTKFAVLGTVVEGLRWADMKFGVATAKTFTLQFGVKAPAGTYCVEFQNSAGNRTYVAEYTITAGEQYVDVVRSIVVPGDVTGTWLTDNGLGIRIYFALMCGPTYQTTAGVWGTATPVFATANQFNFLGSTGYTFDLFDVSLTEGTVAPPFQLPDYASELALCQRYWQINPVTMESTNATVAGYVVGYAMPFPTRMRGVPTVALRTPDLAVNFTGPTVSCTANGASMSGYNTAIGRGYWYGNPSFNARL